MGFDYNAIKALLFAKSLGVDFSVTAMIGRQQLLIDFNSLNDLLKLFKINYDKKLLNSILCDKDEYSEGFLKVLGADKICSIDASSFEGASLIHDMNLPIPTHLKNNFSTVIDGGCLEHIFNFPISIRNCMEMLREGGHFIGITPTNNLMGHGFYQFSPELFFRIFSEENGFAIRKMVAYESLPRANWYEVMDPKIVGERVGILNFRGVYLFILAQKLRDVSIFDYAPQQSDYVSLWNRNYIQDNNKTKLNMADPFLVKLLLIILNNVFIKIITKPFRYINRFNSNHFKKVDIIKYINSEC